MLTSHLLLVYSVKSFQSLENGILAPRENIAANTIPPTASIIPAKTLLHTGSFHLFLMNFIIIIRVTANGQGLLQGWNSFLVLRPEPLLIKDIKVQVNKQKPSDVCPAQMKHNSDKMTNSPMLCHYCTKPFGGRS